MIKKLSISHIKYFICLFLSAFVVIVLSACGSDFDGYVDENVDYTNNTFTVEETNGHKIGVSMPTKDLQRWVQDGENMKSQLHNFGYTVDLLYANNDKNLQNEQIKSMIDSGCEVLVIGAIDGSAIAESLETAKKAGVVVIAYDRLIMGSDAINYYATFDNQLVGTLQGQYIVDALDLKNTQGPYHIELFTGSSDDNNCNFFFGGALEVLQPYINTGKLIVTSGQTTKEQCYTQGWSTDIARERMENILKTYYADGTKLDAVLSSNDSVALGIAEALSAQYNDDFPLLTGQDCDINAVKNIINGKQSMSIHPEFFKTWLIRILINQCKAVLQKQKRYVLTEEMDERELEENSFSDVYFRDILSELSQKDQWIFTLYYEEGYTTKQIAKIIDMKENTIISRLNRGRKKLFLSFARNCQ